MTETNSHPTEVAPIQTTLSTPENANQQAIDQDDIAAAEQMVPTLRRLIATDTDVEKVIATLAGIETESATDDLGDVITLAPAVEVNRQALAKQLQTAAGTGAPPQTFADALNAYKRSPEANRQAMLGNLLSVDEKLRNEVIQSGRQLKENEVESLMKKMYGVPEEASENAREKTSASQRGSEQYKIKKLLDNLQGPTGRAKEGLYTVDEAMELLTQTITNPDQLSVRASLLQEIQKLRPELKGKRISEETARKAFSEILNSQLPTGEAAQDDLDDFIETIHKTVPHITSFDDVIKNRRLLETYNPTLLMFFDDAVRRRFNLPTGTSPNEFSTLMNAKQEISAVDANADRIEGLLKKLNSDLPQQFRDQARVTADYIRLLDSGAEITDPNIREFVQEIANSEFVRAAYANKAIDPTKSLPPWLQPASLQRMGVNTITPPSQQEVQEIAAISQQYAVNKRLQSDGTYVDLPRNNRQPAPLSQQYKCYIEADQLPSLRNGSFYQAMDTLVAQGINPYQYKHYDNGRIVLYFDQSNQQFDQIATVFNKARINLRGPAQDVYTVIKKDGVVNIKPSDSNDNMLGIAQNTRWEYPDYNSTRFLRKYLEICAYAGKNPAHPYETSFLHTYVADKEITPQEQQSIESTQGYPLLLSKQGRRTPLTI